MNVFVHARAIIISSVHEICQKLSFQNWRRFGKWVFSENNIYIE